MVEDQKALLPLSLRSRMAGLKFPVDMRFSPRYVCVLYVCRVQEEPVLVFLIFGSFPEDHDFSLFQVHGQGPGLIEALQVAQLFL